jgi:phosphate transport system substrate-binding protein
MKMKLGIISAVAAISSAVMPLSMARDTVEVVGSSTVYPFATVVAERYGRATGKPTPKIESTGSGGGLKLFCSGVGVSFPDITNSSRRIKLSEFDKCASNGVNEVIEIKVGYDGIVLANSVKADVLNIERKDIFLALAKMVPGNSDGELIENPYKTWQDVNPVLPNTKIEVLGPPPTSGTRDAFAELAMEGGCEKVSWIAAMKKKDKNQYKAICHSIREDGAYIEAGENDNLIVQKLNANPDAFGVFGFSFLEQNADKVQGSLIEGVVPTFDTIADKSYPVSRPLYFYVKQAHVDVVPGIAGYLKEFTSEKAFGEEGYLTDKGMIPMSAEMRQQTRNTAKSLLSMKRSDLL